MLLQEEHDGAHRLLLLPALADTLNAARADAPDLLQKSRTVVNHAQGALAKHLDDLAGEVRSNALHQARAQVFFDSPLAVWRSGMQLLGLELQSVVAIIAPGAGRFDVLAGQGARQMAHDGDQVGPAVGLHAQDGEAVLGVMEGDAFDDAGQALWHSVILQMRISGRPAARRL